MKLKLIEHLSIIIKDIDRTGNFYSKFLGDPIMKTENLVVFKVGDTRMFFKLSPRGNVDKIYDKDGIGMNHIGLGVSSVEEVKRFKEFLSTQGIQTSDLKTGKFGNEYVWFDDPDGIRLEIYRG